MKTTVTINPKYDFLKEYIEQIPVRFEELSDVLYKDRNVIKADQVSNVKLVIKSYHRIYLTNRIRYSYFYASKAKRAFQYGLKLLKKGFLTPEPIAFIECFEYGLLTQSYFISLHSDFTPLVSLITHQQESLMRDLARYTYQLHRHGIYHMDYSLGNILCKKQNEHFEFSLIDNNRMKFGHFSFSRRLKNFRRLGLTETQLTNVAKEYARLEKTDESETIQRIFRYVDTHKERHHLKKKAKKLVYSVGHRLYGT